MNTQAPRLALNLLDGRSASAQPVMLQISEHSAQIIRRQTGDLLLEIPLKDMRKQMRWPEATARGARIVELTDKAPPEWEGAQLHWPSDQDAKVFDAWVAQHVSNSANPSAGWVARAQQSWRGVLVAFVLLVGVIWGMYLYGLPVAARGITALVPQAADQAIGRNALQQIDGRWMTPSKLPLEDQTRIRERFLAGVKKQYPSDTPQIQLEFRKSEIGPNAFALPGGIMVMTDELVQLVKDDEVVLGVLGHELGHITRRHGMRQLVQVGVMQGVLSIAFGDYGSLITAAPLILGSMAYSRAHEREADDESIAYMRAAGISPLVMVKFFQAARNYKPPKKDKDGNDLPPSAEPPAEQADKPKEVKKTPLGFSIISSHPLDEERMEKFRKAAGR
ncbi:M48 family metallopeptidase [Variovorax sp. PCZ-1]|uniref:M48 family metallopeptidase n=1 Tax=Variovorax sp. PCZ-1 TaxID=2835533 RepID=UPI001BCAAC44|nr:M48 family metallopeptidase [Variovorax sp. PCZ-1]